MRWCVCVCVHPCVSVCETACVSEREGTGTARAWRGLVAGVMRAGPQRFRGEGRRARSCLRAGRESRK